MISHSESIVTMPITNPETGRASRTFVFAGRVDLVEDGIVIDWKSTSDATAYLSRQSIGCQAELYALALAAAGVDVRGVEYRLIQKPSIRLCAKDDWDRDLYEVRCYQWLCSTPGALMADRRFFNPARFDYAQRWMWNVSKRVLDCRHCGRWMTNELACQTWGRTCEYQPLCLAEAQGAEVGDLIASMYEPREIHDELDGESRDVLTYSQGVTFCLCEKKAYWRYEAAIRPRHEDTSEALYVGSAIHAGLEAYAGGEGLDAALAAIGHWECGNPVLGEDAARKQDGLIGQARAMVRAAALKWPVAPSGKDDGQ